MILKRKLGESIVIDNSTTVTINEIGGGYVKLAIDAPQEISVNRLEIQQKIDEEKRRDKKG